MSALPRHLIVATDLSDTAANATRRALALAEAHRAKVTLLHLVEPLPMVTSWGDPSSAAWVDVGVLQQAGEAALTRHVEALGLTGHPALATAVRIGLPRADLGPLAQDLGGDLLVLGLRDERRLGDRLLGNTAQAALHHCPLPLLLVRRPAAAPWLHLLAASDFSDGARHATDLASALAPWHARRLLHVQVPLPEATLGLVEASVPLEAYTEAYAADTERQLAEEARRLGAGWIAQLRRGAVAETVLAEAAEHASDLLAIGSRGHGPWLGRLLGSVGQTVVARAHADVLLAAR